MSEADEWSTDGPNITSPKVLEAVRKVLEKGPVIVEHWHYRGARAPSRLVLDDYDEVLNYLKREASPGDAFHLYDYAACCRDDNSFASGKYPDARGRVPRRGAY